jgi:AraC-like DNA-binding protein
MGEGVSAQCGIDVRFFAPPAGYEDSFTTFYRVNITPRSGDVVEDFLQPEWANLRFIHPDAQFAQVRDGEPVHGARMTVHGPTTQATRFRVGETRIWGIGLLPLGWARYIRAPARHYANRVLDGEQEEAFAGFASLAHELFRQAPDDDREVALVIEKFCEQKRPVADEAAIRAVHCALIDPQIATVAAFVERSGIALRSLERLCSRYFGFPPKALLRRQRFMRSLADYMLGGQGNWTGAMDAHYHDQAQFSREFRTFMGMSPREYARLDHPILGAFMEERARIHGSPVQTLDDPAGLPPLSLQRT